MVDPCLRYPGTETLPKVHGQDIVHFIKLRFSSIKIWKGLWIFDWFNNLRQAVKLEHYHSIEITLTHTKQFATKNIQS